MDDKQYVGFWDRFHALIITGLLLSIVELSLAYIIVGDIWMENIEWFHPYALSIGHLVPMLLTIILWLKFSSDPGKLLYKAHIVDATSYKEATLKQYIIRYCGYYISLLPLGLGFWWVIWDKKKQSWHDKMAHTIVVKPKIMKIQARWYITMYRIVISLLIFFMMLGFIFAYLLPEVKPLIKADKVMQNDITQLLDSDLITNEKELLYYYKEEYVFNEIDTSIIAVTKNGVCIINLQNCNVIEKGCYLYKDIKHITVEYDEDIVYIYDDINTEDNLYIDMVIEEKNKLEFKNSVTHFWNKKHK